MTQKEILIKELEDKFYGKRRDIQIHKDKIASLEVEMEDIKGIISDLGKSFVELSEKVVEYPLFFKNRTNTNLVYTVLKTMGKPSTANEVAKYINTNVKEDVTSIQITSALNTLKKTGKIRTEPKIKGQSLKNYI